MLLILTPAAVVRSNLRTLIITLTRNKVRAYIDYVSRIDRYDVRTAINGTTVQYYSTRNTIAVY